MRLTHLNERPSAFTAACAPAHADRVGRLVVIPAAPVSRLPWADHRASVNEQFTYYPSVQSVQLQGARFRIQGINVPTAKATGMAQSLVKGGGASGVPPRGRPV